MNITAHLRKFNYKVIMSRRLDCSQDETIPFLVYGYWKPRNIEIVEVKYITRVLSLSLSLSLSHTYTHIQTHYNSLSHTPSLSLRRTHNFSLFSLSYTHTFTHIIFLSPPLSLILFLSLRYTQSFSLLPSPPSLSHFPAFRHT